MYSSHRSGSACQPAPPGRPSLRGEPGAELLTLSEAATGPDPGSSLLNLSFSGSKTFFLLLILSPDSQKEFVPSQLTHRDPNRKLKTATAFTFVFSTAGKASCGPVLAPSPARVLFYPVFLPSSLLTTEVIS